MNDALASKLKTVWPTRKMKNLYFGYSPNGKQPVFYLDIRPLTKELFVAKLKQADFSLTEKSQIWVGKVSDEDGRPTFALDKKLSTKNFTAAKMQKGLVQLGADARCGLGGTVARAQFAESGDEVDEDLANVENFVAPVEPDDAPKVDVAPVDQEELARSYSTWTEASAKQLVDLGKVGKTASSTLKTFDTQTLPELELKLERREIEHSEMRRMVGADKDKVELGEENAKMRTRIKALKGLRTLIEKHKESFVSALGVASDKRDQSIVEYDLAPSPQSLAKANGRLEGALVRIGDHQERMEGTLAQLEELVTATTLGMDPEPKPTTTPKTYGERVQKDHKRASALKHESEAELRDAKDLRKGARTKLETAETGRREVETRLEHAVAEIEALAGARDKVGTARKDLGKVDATLEKAATIARLLQVKIDALLAKGEAGLSGEELQTLSTYIDQLKVVSERERTLGAEAKLARKALDDAKKELDDNIALVAVENPELKELLGTVEDARVAATKAEAGMMDAEKGVQRRDAEVASRAEIERVAELTEAALAYKANSRIFKMLAQLDLDMSLTTFMKSKAHDEISSALTTFFTDYTIELGRLGATEALEHLFADVPRVLRPEAVDEYGKGFRELERLFLDEDAEAIEEKAKQKDASRKAWGAVSSVVDPVVAVGSKVELVLTGLSAVLPESGGKAEVKIAKTAVTIALLAIASTQKLGDGLAEEETVDPVLQRMQDQQIVEALFALHDAGINIAAQFVPGLSTAKGGLDMLRGMVEAADRFTRGFEDGELAEEAKRVQSALRGALEQSEKRENKLGGKATVDAFGSALSLTGGLITLGGISAPAGVVVDVAGKVVKVGATVVVKVDDWRIAARALELLDGARRGWADEQRELFQYHPKYAKGLLALAAKNRDPIAMRYLQTRGLTEEEVERSTASIIRMFLLSEAGKETDAPKRFTDEIMGVVNTLKSVGAKLLKGLEFIDAHALRVKGTLEKIGEWILGNTAAGKIAAVANAEQVALPLADIRTAITTVQNARALLVEVADVDGVDPGLIRDLQREIETCEATLDEIQGPVLVYVQALQTGERELAAVVEQALLTKHAQTLLAALGRRRKEQVTLLREIAAAA
ncbi:MAG: hypothetical protein V4850_35475 [Myxococcota bacterium]